MPKRRRARLSLFVLAAIGLMFVVYAPFLSNGALRVVDAILLYVMLGLALNIVVGYAGLLDLGFIAFYAIGAYTYAFLSSDHFGLHLPFLAILAIAVLVALVAGVLLGLPVLRLRGDYFAIVTLGFGEIIRVMINNLDVVTGGPRGIARLDKINIAGVNFSTPLEMFWLLVAFCALTMIFVYRLERSLLGRAWAAIREDQDAAAGVGVNVVFAKLAAFAISAAIGAIAGVIFAGFQRFVSPESFIFSESLLVVLIIVIGGLGNMLGIVVGAVVLVLLPEVLRDYAELRMLILGLLLATIIIVRPNGIVSPSFNLANLLASARKKPVTGEDR